MHESCVLESVGLRLSVVSGYQQILRSHAMLRVLFCLVSSRRMNCQSMYNVRGVRFVLVAMHEVPYPFSIVCAVEGAYVGLLCTMCCVSASMYMCN